MIERWRPQDERPEILVEHLEWTPAGAGSLPIELADLFGRIHGETL